MTDPSAAKKRSLFRSPLSVMDRMISGDLLKSLLSVLMVLVIIIVSRKFMRILAQAIEGEVAAGTLFQLLGLKTLSAIAMLIPPSLFMAVLTVIGRMYRDHEMSILASAGVGSRRLYQSLLWTVIPVFLFSGWMALFVMPWSERQSQELMKRDEATADIRGIKPGRFNEFRAGDVVLYAEEMNIDRTMRSIFVQSRQSDNTGVVVAERGRLEKSESGDDFVILSEGRRYQGVPGSADYVISEFEEYGVRISGPEEESAALKREAEESLRLLAMGSPRELAELQKRLSIPFGVLGLTLLAVPLARVAPRQGPYGSVFSAFLIYLAYGNAQKISQGLLLTGKVSFWVNYAGIYGCLILITLGLFLRNLGPRWIRHALGWRRES